MNLRTPAVVVVTVCGLAVATPPHAVVAIAFQAAESNVVLVNKQWEMVNVEVRRGNEPDCANNATFETKKLFRSDKWSIPAPSVDVCYRRDRDPDHPNGQWTNWRKVSPTSSGDTVVAIN